MKPKISISHTIMFILFALPSWIISFTIKDNIMKAFDGSIWLILSIQTIPLISLWIYTSVVPSIIGQIRSAITNETEDLSETVPISVTTRVAFLAISLAGFALIGLNIGTNINNYPSLLILSIIYFILSFITLTLSTDISDSAKNIPFRRSKAGVILTRRGARLYQYGLTFLICGFACFVAQINEVLSYVFIIAWNLMYILTNLPTKKSEYNIKYTLYILIMSYLLMLFPIYLALINVLDIFTYQKYIFGIYMLLLMLIVLCILVFYKKRH